MVQTQQIIEAVKRQLRKQGITYAQVAHDLGLSEARIKHMFAKHEFSLKRLEQICLLMGMDLLDLMSDVEQQQEKLEQLSESCEQQLVDNTRLMLVCVCVLNYWNFQRIAAVYDYSKVELIGHLTQLDKMGVIELLPNNRFRLRVHRRFHWRHNGPIEQFFEQQVQPEFLKCDFKGPGELRLMINGMLTRESNSRLQQRLHAIAKEFDDWQRAEKDQPPEERFGTSLLIALRPWELPLFNSYRREKDQREF